MAELTPGFYYAKVRSADAKWEVVEVINDPTAGLRVLLIRGVVPMEVKNVHTFGDRVPMPA